MQKFNYHTHTYRCGHSDSDYTDEEYIIDLIRMGFMIIECMKILLDEDKFKESEDLFYAEIDKLKERLSSIDVND